MRTTTNTTNAPQPLRVDYELPDFSRVGAANSVQHAWARVPVAPAPAERDALKSRIAELLRQKNAVLVAHY